MGFLLNVQCVPEASFPEHYSKPALKKELLIYSWAFVKESDFNFTEGEQSHRDLSKKCPLVLGVKY